MTQKLIEALMSLDTENDDHWTQDGLPRLDVLKSITGESVSRSDIANVSKKFNRFNPTIEGENDEQETEETVETEATETAEATQETTTEPPVVTNEEIKDDVEQHMSEAAQAELELTEAREALSLAQKRFKEAQKKADGFRAAKAKEQQSIPPHLAIRAFQRSQQAQRASETGRTEALRKALQGASPEEAELLKQNLNDIL